MALLNVGAIRTLCGWNESVQEDFPERSTWTGVAPARSMSSDMQSAMTPSPRFGENTSPMIAILVLIFDCWLLLSCTAFFDGGVCLVDEQGFLAGDGYAIFECVCPHHLFWGLEYIVVGHEVGSLLDCFAECIRISCVHCGGIEGV